MIATLGTFGLALICFGIYYLCEKFGQTYSDYSGWGIAGVFLAIAVVVLLIVIPISHMDLNASLREFDAVNDSLVRARTNLDISQFEIAAIQQKVIESNKWLANAQYWANHPFSNWFYPSIIKTYVPIR